MIKIFILIETIVSEQDFGGGVSGGGTSPESEYNGEYLFKGETILRVVVVVVVGLILIV